MPEMFLLSLFQFLFRCTISILLFHPLHRLQNRLGDGLPARFLLGFRERPVPHSHFTPPMICSFSADLASSSSKNVIKSSIVRNCIFSKSAFSKLSEISSWALVRYFFSCESKRF